MPDNRPLLVIVGGTPASGKTTLANLLARELRLPLLARDTLKEALMDSLGSPSRARSMELGGASYALLFVVLDRLLDAGVGAILESNFSRGRSEAELHGADSTEPICPDSLPRAFATHPDAIHPARGKRATPPWPPRLSRRNPRPPRPGLGRRAT